jgi:hypothetical protein
VLNDYVLPHIGSMKVKDITPPALNEMWSKLETDGCSREHLTLKPFVVLANYFPDDTPLYKIANECWGHTDAHSLTRIMEGGVCYRETAEKLCDYLAKSVNELFASDKAERPLAELTIAGIVTAVSAVFTAAVKAQIIRDNSVSRSTPPKGHNHKNVDIHIDVDDAQRILTVLNELPDAG